jgi:hypothetical protein
VAALIVAGVLTVGVLVGALALTTASSNRSGSLELVLERFATSENPLPSTMTVSLDGVVQDVVWQGDVATIEFRDAFSTADEATVSLAVPERVEFPVAQPAENIDGVPRVVVRITDDTVVVEGTDETFPRANPAGEARRIEAERQRAEAERLRAEATAVRVERERVGAVLAGVSTQLFDVVDARYEAFWAERGELPSMTRSSPSSRVRCCRRSTH